MIESAALALESKRQSCSQGLIFPKNRRSVVGGGDELGL